MTPLAARGPGGWPFWALPMAVFAGLWAATLVARRLARRRAERGTTARVSADRQVAVGATVVGGVCVAAGLALFLAYTAWPVYRAYRADAWPTTGGVVRSSAIGRSHGGKGGTTYRVDIHYRYAVDGRTYESNQYDGSGTRIHTSAGYDAIRTLVAAHPPGTPVTVYYDPRDPADAMLSTHVPVYTMTLGWIPLVFVAFGVVTVVGVRRAARVPDPSDAVES